MISRNILFVYVLTISLGVQAFQATASERKEPGAHRNNSSEVEGRSGVINRIDFANGQLVIDDLKFSFFPQQLIVRKNGHVSSIKELRENQRVRYRNKSRASGSASSGNSVNRVISEIWIE